MPKNPNSEAVVYTQFEDSLLYSLNQSSDVGISSYWSGFFSSGSGGLSGTATLDQVWNDKKGVFLFLSTIPPDMSRFIAFLEEFFSTQPLSMPFRFLWIKNPNDMCCYWQYDFINTIPCPSIPANELIAKQVLLRLGDYVLQIMPGATLALADPTSLGEGIVITSAAAVEWIGLGVSFTAEEGKSWLPLSGALLGCWIYKLGISASGNDCFPLMGVSLTYAMLDKESLVNEVKAFSMPCLAQGSASFNLNVTYDPLFPLNPNRTAFIFDVSTTSPSFASYWSTILGYDVALAPSAARGNLNAGRLVFNKTPMYVVDEGETPYNYYLTLDGAFTITLAQPPSGTAGLSSNRLLLGLSALEYVYVPGGNGVMFFSAGNAAYIMSSSPNDGTSLTALATTAYATILSNATGTNGLTYYAQSKQAPLFYANGIMPPAFLDFHELAGQALPGYSDSSSASPPLTFPIGAYKGFIQATSEVVDIENITIAPARRKKIGSPIGSYSPSNPDTASLGVTPQGLAALLTNDLAHWAGVVLGNLPSNTHPRIALTKVGPDFQAVLQNNQIFTVVANADIFMASSSVSYQLTEQNLPLLAGEGVPQATIDAIKTIVSGMTPPYPVFVTEDGLKAAIANVAGNYLPKVYKVAGLLKPNLSGWTFQLSPRSWRQSNNTPPLTPIANPTLMLMNFCNQSIVQMIEKQDSWAWQQVAIMDGKTITDTQQVLRDFVADCEAAPADTPRKNLYNNVLNSPDWNGVLFLNAPISIADLPADLQFITAGINQDEFYAHHIGFSLTAFNKDNGNINLHQTSVFGLIDYNDPVDLYVEKTVPFGFKTLQVSARFANAALVDFHALVELLINNLFGGEVTKFATEHGNNLRLSGSYQLINGAPSYGFSLIDSNKYMQLNSALQSMEILSVQLQTRHTSQLSTLIRTAFILGGRMNFQQLYPFDLYSYGNAAAQTDTDSAIPGYLQVSNLVVNMEFDVTKPGQQNFTVSDTQLSFDLANSIFRSQSLAAHFPMKLTRIISTQDGKSTPEDLGYVSIVAPMDQTLLADNWYGLNFELELGTLGALAGSIGLKINLIAGWAVGDNPDNIPMYVGIQLPSASSMGLNLSLQGVINLGFRSFQFLTYLDESNNVGYMLKLQRLALTILGMSFPPGNTDIYLFGNPKGNNQDTKLGWYAAYSKDKKTNKTNSIALSSPKLLTTGNDALPTPELPNHTNKRIARRMQSGRRKGF